MGEIHWCLGMYASASTWLFNVARAIAATAEGPQGVRSHFARSISDIRAMVPPETVQATIVKSHETFEGVEAWLAERARTILVTIRDPRDVVLSVMRYQRHDFDMALEHAWYSGLTCARRMNDPRALVLRFESGFAGDPGTIRQVADAMGYAVDGDDVARIFADHTRAAVEAKIVALGRSEKILRQVGGPDYMDWETQWHLHHANREGRVGAWRGELRGARLETVQSRMGGLMDVLGYPPEPGSNT